MITGQVKVGRRWAARGGEKERERRGGVGHSAQLLFFQILQFLFLVEFEKRRKLDKAKVKIRVLIFPQHKMLVKLQTQNIILICFVQKIVLVVNLFVFAI